MKKIEIEIPDGKVAKWIDGVLTLVDDKPKDITERVKTFEDACEELGDEHPLVKEYWGVVNINLDITQDLISYLKLRIIITALNEGWKPIFDDHEWRYYVYFSIFTKADIKELSEADKKYCIYIRPSNATYDAFFCAHGGCSGSNTNTYNGTQFAFKTRALAEYCCEQFMTIWKDFMFAKL